MRHLMSSFTDSRVAAASGEACLDQARFDGLKKGVRISQATECHGRTPAKRVTDGEDLQTAPAYSTAVAP